jgi:hypothetical protein
MFQTLLWKRKQLGINRCKFSEFRSKPFRGREHNSEFLSVQQKIEIYGTLGMPCIVSEKTTFDVQTNHFVKFIAAVS